MSKHSIKNNRSKKLEDSLTENLLLNISDKDDLSEEEIFFLPPEDFLPVTYNEKIAERIGYSNYSYWQATWRMFLKNKLALIMLLIILLTLGFAIVQPYIPGQHNAVSINNYPPGHPLAGMPISNKKPCADFWFGTNSIGQDLWSMIWSGTRTSLIIGFCSAFIEGIIGTITGLLWGYIRKFDFIFTETYNVLNNIPSIIILILASYVMDSGIISMIIAISLTGWIGLARFIRNQVLVIRDRDFNLASRCLGTPTYRIIIKNLIPQMISVIMLRMALAIPGAIGSEVFLSYIGLGLPIDVPSLGNLVNTGRALMSAPSLQYQLWFPAAALSIITICFYIVGNAFADAADPKNHR